MSLEQHMYGSTDWHLPSPSSTPKSATFPEANLKTPKTDSVPQSHFLDAWATPRVYEQQTPVQTPSFTLSTPIDRPPSAYSPALRTPEDPEFHVNHFAPQNLPLPPVEVARRLSSSPDPHRLKKLGGGNPLGSQLAQQGPVSMDFSHMQTPPPTRDATSRRGLQQSGGSAFATPATVIHRTPYQAPPAEALFDQTPFGLVNVQYTPDMMQFPNNAAISAPPMPQSRLFWDQANDVSHMDVDLPYQDPFGPTPHRVEQDINWQALQSPVATQMHSQPFQSFQNMPPQGQMASFGAGNMGAGQSSQANSFVSTSAGVDPNMLFSFSNPGTTASFGNMPQLVPKMDASSRQPYDTQMGSIRDREPARKARSQHSRSNTNSSSGSVESMRPGLQRSNTDSGFRKNRTLSIESRISAPAAASSIPRRMSPLKRSSGASLKSIPEIRRPRTRLIVDETGRARTETVTAEEEDTPKPTRKPSQTDLRRQYPGLWEEDDTESEDEEPAATISRNTSFNISQPQRRATKHARADSGNLDRANTFKIPRPSSRTSCGAFDKASFDPARPIRKPIERPTRSFSMMEFPKPVDHSNLTESSNNLLPNSPGDALGALKKVVAGRQHRVERASHNTLKAHNQRWAQASADINHSPHGHGQYDPFSNSFNGSPNTDTPSTDRSSLSSESTRCVCNGVDEGQLMVQCESCSKWLHMGCLGFTANNLPPVYVCVFCTGSTPVARGGRLRGPIPFDSPLNHKTIFRR